MKAIKDCPYCGQLMDVSEDTMEKEENLSYGWYREGIFGSEDVCRCPHCGGRFIREIEYELKLEGITLEREED